MSEVSNSSESEGISLKTRWALTGAAAVAVATALAFSDMPEAQSTFKRAYAAAASVAAGGVGLAAGAVGGFLIADWVAKLAPQAEDYEKSNLRMVMTLLLAFGLAVGAYKETKNWFFDIEGAHPVLEIRDNASGPK